VIWDLTIIKYVNGCKVFFERYFSSIGGANFCKVGKRKKTANAYIICHIHGIMATIISVIAIGCEA